MIKRATWNRCSGYIEAGSDEGARLVLGGKRVLEETGGYFVEPTIFDDVPQRHEDRPRGDLRPGAVGDRVRHRGGSDRHGQRHELRPGCVALHATTSTSRTASPARSAAGTVSVNCYSEGDITTPFGGYKQSGFVGRDKSIFAHEQYTELKTIWIDMAEG